MECNQLENVLYARPIPDDGDLAGALKLCTTIKVPEIEALLTRLSRNQAVIGEVSAAWDMIPESSFGGAEKKLEFLQLAVREGLFRTLVMWDESLRQVKHVRPVLQQLLANLHDIGQGKI